MTLKVKPINSSEPEKIGMLAKWINPLSRTYLLPFEINYKKSTITMSWKSKQFILSCAILTIPFLIPFTFVLLQPNYYSGKFESVHKILKNLLNLALFLKTKG